MRTFYQCEICEANHGKEDDALQCEAKGFHPLYEIEDKVLYRGAVVTITKRHIVSTLHSFIYMFNMKPEDNPGKILSGCGWKGENELSKLPNLQKCA